MALFECRASKDADRKSSLKYKQLREMSAPLKHWNSSSTALTIGAMAPVAPRIRRPVEPTGHVTNYGVRPP